VRSPIFTLGNRHALMALRDYVPLAVFKRL
jgi:hypothetical protein